MCVMVPKRKVHVRSSQITATLWKRFVLYTRFLMVAYSPFLCVVYSRFQLVAYTPFLLRIYIPFGVHFAHLWVVEKRCLIITFVKFAFLKMSFKKLYNFIHLLSERCAKYHNYWSTYLCIRTILDACMHVSKDVVCIKQCDMCLRKRLHNNAIFMIF